MLFRTQRFVCGVSLVLSNEISLKTPNELPAQFVGVICSAVLIVTVAREPRNFSSISGGVIDDVRSFPARLRRRADL